ncbi:Prenyltransferase [Gracilaria domingensis]|nr:Prenyltransferase [Gracilaria domingensis]
MSLSSLMFRKRPSSKQSALPSPIEHYSQQSHVFPRSLRSVPASQSPNRSFQSSPMFLQLKALQEQAKTAYNTISTTPYGRLMRLDKPVGINLLFLPCAWSIGMHGSIPQMMYLLPLFYAGAAVMRGAGCTINDIWDVDIDRQVARTRKRPIASGEISVNAAIASLVAQLLAALGILTCLNESSFLVASLGVLPVMFYPLAKRRFVYPQAALGMTFNWGALLGCAATTSSITLPSALLYGSGICWTMIYDTIYAHQDKSDDKKLGIGSTALAFGDRSKQILAGFMGAQMAFLLAAGASAGLGTTYYMGITAAMIHSGYHLNKVELSKPRDCFDAFLSHQITGSLIWASILCGRVL